MVVHLKYLVCVVFTVLALSSCYNTPVRHLASDAALIEIGKSNRNDVRTYLGEPDEQIILDNGEERWLYTEFEDSMVKDAPYVGKYFGEHDYGTVTVTIKNDIVTECIYDAWEYDSDDWADDFKWQENKK